jgi:hypothetical protein
MLFETALACTTGRMQSTEPFNGYLVWHRERGRSQIEIWRRASDPSGFQVLNPDEKQTQCVARAQQLYEPIADGNSDSTRHDFVIKNERPRGEFIPCATITVSQHFHWYRFSFPLLYICCPSVLGRGRDVFIYDVRTLELVRAVEDVIQGYCEAFNDEHALLLDYNCFLRVIDQATFRDELLVIGADSWWIRAWPGAWRQTITNNIFTLWSPEARDRVVNLELRRGMSPLKPSFSWRSWSHLMFSPEGVDIVRIQSSYDHVTDSTYVFQVAIAENGCLVWLPDYRRVLRGECRTRDALWALEFNLHPFYGPVAFDGKRIVTAQWDPLNAILKVRPNQLYDCRALRIAGARDPCRQSGHESNFADKRTDITLLSCECAVLSPPQLGHQLGIEPQINGGECLVQLSSRGTAHE